MSGHHQPENGADSPQALAEAAAERVKDALEHFVDPEAGAYGHENRDNCREVLAGLMSRVDSRLCQSDCCDEQQLAHIHVGTDS